MILFDNVEDSYIIVEILNDVRKYVINSNLNNKELTDHQKTFEVTVEIEQQWQGSGKGRSKKIAEQEAAKQALDQLRPVTEAG